MRISQIILAILAFASCNDPGMITRLDGTRITDTFLDQEISRLVNAANVAGLSVSIFNKGQPVYLKAFGYANFDTKEPLKSNNIFYGASLSKAVFGYIVARLVEDGTLDLDIPLQSYVDFDIPDLPVDKEFLSLAPLRSDERYKQISARMCMSHTTGLPNWRWIEDDKKLKFLYDPGQRYNYSGEGMMILQWVIEHITAKDLEDLAEDMVFEPLGMTSTSYAWRKQIDDRFCNGHTEDQRSFFRKPETEHANAAGSLVTSPDDYSKFIQHILQLEQESSPVTGLMFNPNVRIRSKAQFGPLSRQETTQYDHIALSYGLGWGLLSTPYGPGAFKEGHDQGFQHYSIVFPEKLMAIVIMSNSDNGESIFKELLELAIQDVYTPWQWENYIPYNFEKG